MSLVNQFEQLAKSNPNDFELGSKVRSALDKMKKSKRWCNFCHCDTYTQDEDCVDCGFSKTNHSREVQSDIQRQ